MNKLLVEMLEAWHLPEGEENKEEEQAGKANRILLIKEEGAGYTVLCANWTSLSCEDEEKEKWSWHSVRVCVCVDGFLICLLVRVG